MFRRLKYAIIDFTTYTALAVVGALNRSKDDVLA